MNITDITRFYELYNINSDADYNYEYTTYKMRKLINFNHIYNISDDVYIEKESIVNNINVNNSGIINNSYIDNATVHNNFYNQHNITITNALSTNDLVARNMTNTNFINIGNNNQVTNCVINNDFYTNSDINIYDILSTNNILTDTIIFNNAITANTIFTTNTLSDNIESYNNITIISDSLIDNLTCSNDANLNNMIVNDFTNLMVTTCDNMICLKESIINSNLYVTNAIILNNGAFNHDCHVLGLYKNENACTANNVFVKNYINCELQEYYDNESAGINGIVYGQLYRTGGIVKIRISLNNLTISLNGNPIMYSYINNYFNDPLFDVIDYDNVSYKSTIIGDIDYNTLGQYNLSYRITDNYNNNSNILTRLVYVIDYPTINNIIFTNGILTFDATGSYDNNYNFISYTVYKNTNILQSNILLTNITSIGKSIDINNISLDIDSYNISILVHNQMNEVIKTVNVFLNIDGIDLIVEINGHEPYKVNLNDNFNIFNNIEAYTATNDVITLYDNNFSIYDNLDNIITTSSGNVTFEYNKSYNINISIGNRIQHSYIYTIQVYELDKPIITLIGNSEINILKDNPYIDPGYNIQDASNGVIDKVVGYVNTNLRGTYFIKYIARDYFNNIQTTIRQINVI